MRCTHCGNGRLGGVIGTTCFVLRIIGLRCVRHLIIGTVLIILRVDLDLILIDGTFDLLPYG